MVEVFKTNVREKDQAQRLMLILVQEFPFSKINFDLEDCDRILRMEAEWIAQDRVIEVLEGYGYRCSLLEE